MLFHSLGGGMLGLLYMVLFLGAFKRSKVQSVHPKPCKLQRSQPNQPTLITKTKDTKSHKIKNKTQQHKATYVFHNKTIQTI